MECADVQALPPPFSLEAPQFAPQISNRDRGDPEPSRHFQVGKPVSLLARHRCRGGACLTSRNIDLGSPCLRQSTGDLMIGSRDRQEPYA
jgi:hypothetical protein